MSLLENEWFIEAPWGKLCVIAWGDCYDPPVLACHGVMDSAATFRPLVKLLPNKYYYIGIELPGSGRSDPLPPGLMISVYDLVYTIQVVVKHFRWDSFIYMGHSLGCTIGKIYNISYPGKISKLIELDPVTISIVVQPEDFPRWYKQLFTDYFDNYKVYNSPKENGPKYRKDEAITKLMNLRGLTEETAEATLVRWSKPAGDDFIRFTYDQRNKKLVHPPFSAKQLQHIFTNMKVPILSVVAKSSIKMGLYASSPFVFHESEFPRGNYRVRIVPGNHDVHFIHPERVAPYVTQFLLYGVQGLDKKSKI